MQPRLVWCVAILTLIGCRGTPVEVPPCTAETDPQLCARLGKSCGAVTGTDNCGDVRSVSNCGSCATRVFTFAGQLHELACNATHVYASVFAADGGASLWRVPLDGGAPPEVIDTGSFSAIAIEGTRVYYLMDGDGAANEVRVYDGANVSTAVSCGGAQPWTFALDATSFWVATGSANTMASFVWQQVPRDGSPVTNFGTQLTPEALLPFALHRTTAHLVWSRQDRSGQARSPDVWWVPITGGAMTDFDLPPGRSVVGFDVVGDQLLLLVEVSQDADVVQVMAIGGQPTTVVEVPGSASGGLHADEAHIYFTTYYGALWRADRDGGTVQKLQDGLSSSSRVEGCDQFVLFDNKNSDNTTTVYAVAKP